MNNKHIADEAVRLAQLEAALVSVTNYNGRHKDALHTPGSVAKAVRAEMLACVERINEATR